MDKELSPDFIIKVNEIFHDVEAENYTSEHPEIFELEKKRWQILAKKFFKNASPLKVLDIGSGTGFVPLNIAPYLKPLDEVICSDISGKMLERCRANLSREGFNNKFSYLKVNDEKLELENASIDIVTLNSVLHHLPETEKIFKEINRVLKPGGLLIIAHEPNQDFFRHKFLWFNYKLWRLLTSPRFLLEAMMKRLGLKMVFEKHFQDQSRYTPAWAKVNQELIKAGLVVEPLSPWKMGKIVDYYSASGFSVAEIKKKYLPDYQMVFFETYNHLYRVFMYAHKNVILRAYNNLLSKIFPKKGATFTAVFKKNL